MSQRTAKQARHPTFEQQLLRAARQVAKDYRPGYKAELLFVHANDCPRLAGLGPCRCQPSVTVNWQPIEPTSS